MLWRIPADTHEQRIGVMAPTQAFFGCPQPATRVSATRVFPARLPRRQWQNACGNCGNPRDRSIRHREGRFLPAAQQGDRQRAGCFPCPPQGKTSLRTAKARSTRQRGRSYASHVLAVGRPPGLTSRSGGSPVPIQYTPRANSTYLDYDSYRSDAPAPTGAGAVGNFTFNVALVLDRANDPTALLQSDWASRQQQLETLNESGTLWSTYGANSAAYNQVLSQLGGLGIQTVNQIDPVNGYVSSAESRTVWVQVDQSNFATLFGTPLVAGHDQAGHAVTYWQGNLSLPQPLAALGVKGLWFDTDMFGTVLAPSGVGSAAALPQGAQGIGNSAPRGDVVLFPQDIAQNDYNFPLSGALWDPSSGHAVGTGTIGLLEPGIGSALEPDTPAGEFQSLLDAYRQTVGISTSGRVTTIAPGGQQVTSDAGERSLDVGVATAINPQSPLVLYAGSGFSANANADAYTAYQAAFWDTANNPDVVSS